jgi:prevent-host-death family protein
MDRTNANDFRANLKEWMEAARSEPIKITRKSGEAFVLINADDFEKMQFDLIRLQGIAAGLSDMAHGRVRPATEESTREVLNRAKDRALAAKRSRKASGD